VDTLGTGVPVVPEMVECSSYDFGDGGLPGYLGGLADSQGARGPLDSLTWGVGSGTSTLDRSALPNSLPHTSTGVSVGSSLSELQAAYAGKLEIEKHLYIPGGHYAYVTGPNNTAIVFDTDVDDVVYQVNVGRFPEVRYVEGCH
jgi:hypothetical protein